MFTEKTKAQMNNCENIDLLGEILGLLIFIKSVFVMLSNFFHVKKAMDCFGSLLNHSVQKNPCFPNSSKIQQ